MPPVNSIGAPTDTTTTSCSTPYPAPVDTVSLSFSGVEATVARSSLLSPQAGSFFNHLVDGKMAAPVDAAGRIFIGRRSTVVEPLLRFIDTGRLPPGLSEAQQAELQEDVDYFDMPLAAAALTTYPCDQALREPLDTQELEALVARFPDHVGLRVRLGEACENENAWDAAITHFVAAARLEPDDPHLQKKLTDAYRKLGHKGAFVEDLLRRRVSSCPTDTQAGCDLAIFLILKAVRKWVVAEAADAADAEVINILTTIIETSAEAKKPYRLRSLAWLLQGNRSHSRALADANSAVEQDPFCDQARTLRGVVKYKMGRHRSAKDDFKAAYLLAPCKPLNCRNLALIFDQMEKLEKSEKYLAIYIEKLKREGFPLETSDLSRATYEFDMYDGCTFGMR